MLESIARIVALVVTRVDDVNNNDSRVASGCLRRIVGLRIFRTLVRLVTIE